MMESLFVRDLSMSVNFFYVDQPGDRHNGSVSYARPLDPKATIEMLVDEAERNISRDLKQDNTVVNAIVITRINISIESLVR